MAEMENLLLSDIFFVKLHNVTQGVNSLKNHDSEFRSTLTAAPWVTDDPIQKFYKQGSYN